MRAISGPFLPCGLMALGVRTNCRYLSLAPAHLPPPITASSSLGRGSQGRSVSVPYLLTWLAPFCFNFNTPRDTLLSSQERQACVASSSPSNRYPPKTVNQEATGPWTKAEDLRKQQLGTRLGVCSHLGGNVCPSTYGPLRGNCHQCRISPSDWGA